MTANRAPVESKMIERTPTVSRPVVFIFICAVLITGRPAAIEVEILLDPPNRSMGEDVGTDGQ